MNFSDNRTTRQWSINFQLKLSIICISPSKTRGKKQSPLVDPLLLYSDSEDGQENVSIPPKNPRGLITALGYWIYVFINILFIGKFATYKISSSDSEDRYVERRPAVGPLVRLVEKQQTIWEAQEPLSDQKVSSILLCLLREMKDLTSFHRRNQHVRIPSNSEIDEKTTCPLLPTTISILLNSVLQKKYKN